MHSSYTIHALSMLYPRTCLFFCLNKKGRNPLKRLKSLINFDGYIQVIFEQPKLAILSLKPKYRKKMHLSLYDIECIQSAKDFIDADVTCHYSIPEIATHAGLSGTKLKEGFKLSFGKGLFRYLKDHRLEKGKYLVENTDKTLREISRGLGYRHVCNFITAFKKEFGKSPGMLRNKIIIWIIHLHWLNYSDMDYTLSDFVIQAGNFYG